MGTTADLNTLLVAGTGLGRIELRKFSGFCQDQILSHRAFHRPINRNAGCHQFIQRSAADTADYNCINVATADCFQRLALAVQMIQILIYQGLGGP